LSPQTRRTRTAPSGHRKSSAHVASTTPVKPAASTEETGGEQVESSKQASVRHGRRQHDLGRVKKTSGYRYMNELFGAYTPVLIAFVVLFAAVWGWISFGPHPATPQENWTRIENAWLTKREDARIAVSKATTNFTAQIAAYEDYRNATSGWMTDLGKVTDWKDARKTAAQNDTVTADMSTFVQAGNDEITLFDQMTASQTPVDVASYAQNLQDAELTFNTDYAQVRSDIMGNSGSKASPGPVALPSLTVVPCPSPDPSSSPDPAATPAVCYAESPTASPAPSATPAPSASPAAVSSAGPSVSPAAVSSAGPSVSPAAVSSAGPSVSPAASLSAKPS